MGRNHHYKATPVQQKQLCHHDEVKDASTMRCKCNKGNKASVTSNDTSRILVMITKGELAEDHRLAFNLEGASPKVDDFAKESMSP